MAKWPFEDSVIVPAGWQCLAILAQGLQGALYALNLCLIYIISLIARFHKSWNQAIEMHMVPLTITPSY